MRTLLFAGIAALMAAAPAAGESLPMRGGRTVPDWGGVPSIPLTPPGAAMAPAPAMPTGNWSGSGGWRGAQGNWDRGGHAMPPGPRGNWGNWHGGGRMGMMRFRPRPGFFMPRVFVSPTFFVSDWWNYGLREPGYGRNWVRYYDDAALIDDRGYIYDTAPGVDWGEYGQGYARPYPAAVYYVPAGSTTVIVQGAPTVTTTTTTYVDEVRVWKARPKRAWRSGRKCACK